MSRAVQIRRPAPHAYAVGARACARVPRRARRSGGAVRREGRGAALLDSMAEQFSKRGIAAALGAWSRRASAQRLRASRCEEATSAH
eukprot:6212090-Pleurochrysis_carterae.AAC.1